MFFINSRFRLPVIPFIIILAANGIDELVYRYKNSRKYSILLISLVPAVAVYIFSTGNLFKINQSNFASGNYKLGNFNLFYNRFDEAKKYYNLTLDSDSKYPNANLNLGATYLRMGVEDSAEYYFKKEIEFYPENAKAYSNLASLHYLREEFNGAIEMAEKSIELKPYFADPYLILIRIYQATGDTLEFLEIIKRGEKSLDDKSELYYESALVYSNRGNTEKAINLLLDVYNNPAPPIETDDNALSYSFYKSKKAESAYQLGYLYGIRGDLVLSKQYSEQAIQLDSNIAEAYINLANAHVIGGNRITAREILTAAENKFPDNQIIKQFLQTLR
jgi:tetratricopeptide (TPR) repeat protein